MSSEIPITAPKDDDFAFEAPPRPKFRRRILCWVFDLAVIGVLGSLINYFLLGIDPVDPIVPVESDASNPNVSNIEFVSTAFFGFLYFGIMHGTFGKTPGKMIGGFRVVRMNGSGIGYGRAFVRAFWGIGIFACIEMPRLLYPEAGLEWVSDVGALYVLVNFLAFLWDQRTNRALPDLFAGTRTTMDA